MALGWAAARDVAPVFQSNATVTFQNERQNLVQVTVMWASVDAVLRNPVFVADIERLAGLRLRRVWAQPAGFNAVTVSVQGYGDPARVSAASRAAAERAASQLSDTGLNTARGVFASRSSGLPTDRWETLLSTADAVFGIGLETGRRQGRVDQEVVNRVPGPIVATARPWYDVPLAVAGDPSPPQLMRQRFVLAGFLIGIGLAILFSASIVALARFRAEPMDPPGAPAST